MRRRSFIKKLSSLLPASILPIGVIDAVKPEKLFKKEPTRELTFSIDAAVDRNCLITELKGKEIIVLYRDYKEHLKQRNILDD